MKKLNLRPLIGLILAVLLLVPQSLIASADVEDNSSINVIEIQDGHMCWYEDEVKRIAILTNDDTQYISGSVSYDEWSAYQFTSINLSDTTYDPNSNAFWNAIIAYMEEHMEYASFVEIEVEECDELSDSGNSGQLSISSGDTAEIQSSVTADLIDELKARVGSPYTNNPVSTMACHGLTMSVKETMVQRITRSKKLSWSSALTIASLASSILSIANPTSAVISAIATALGVADAASTIIPAGKAVQYRCRALYTRHTYVEGVTDPCNSTSKYVDYYGIDDGDSNSTNRAKIYSPSAETSYSHSGRYYGTPSYQCSDAYDYYIAYYK